MPFFDIGQSGPPIVNNYTTNVSGNTQSDHILGIAGATQGFGLVELYGAVKNSATVGGGMLRATTGGTSAAGSAATASKRDQNSQAASSTWSFTITSAGNPAARLSVGFAQTGGQGGWMTYMPYAAIQVPAGVTNKLEIFSITLTASQSLDISVGIYEGSGGT